jgi:hypothetical protein
MPIRSAAEPIAQVENAASRKLAFPRHAHSRLFDRAALIRKTSLSSDRSDSTAVKQCRQNANAISSRRDFVTDDATVWRSE